MRMKKIGLLSLALVLALALTGAGFAKWSDTVTIKGTVDTGKVKIGILNVATDDPGPNFLDGGVLYPDGKNPLVDGTADPAMGPGHNTEGKNVASHISTNSESGCLKDVGPLNLSVRFYKKVTETIANAYPWYSSGTKLWLTNCGTIPVKIEKIETISHSDLDGLDPFIVFDTWTAIRNDGSGWKSWTSGTSLDGLSTFLSGCQIDPCHTIQVYIPFHFQEEANAATMPQNATLTFEYKVTCTQWNEVA